LEHGIFDADEYNIYGTGTLQEQYGFKSMGKEDANLVYSKLHQTPLKTLIKEFLAKSSTTGIMGAAYLIPTKIRQIMADWAHTKDIIEEVSMAIIGADEIAGATHQVDIAVEGSYKPKVGSSGAAKPYEEIETVQATLDFTKPWYINFAIGNDLIEDSQFNLIEQHIRMAGAEMGAFSTSEILHVMYGPAGAGPTDGDGTANTTAAGNSTTTAAQVRAGYDTIVVDHFIPTHMLASYAVILDAIVQDTTYMVTGSADAIRTPYLKAQDGGLFGLQWVRCEAQDSIYLYQSTGDIFYTYLYCKDYSYLSGRKRWLRLENYSDPVRDLVGAVISSRQDTVSIYDDSTCILSET
jgi:hypothetical protein